MNQNSMYYWFPRIEHLDIPMPRTTFCNLNADAIFCQCGMLLAIPPTLLPRQFETGIPHLISPPRIKNPRNPNGNRGFGFGAEKLIHNPSGSPIRIFNLGNVDVLGSRETSGLVLLMDDGHVGRFTERPDVGLAVLLVHLHKIFDRRFGAGHEAVVVAGVLSECDGA